MNHNPNHHCTQILTILLLGGAALGWFSFGYCSVFVEVVSNAYSLDMLSHYSQGIA
ncbi:hypothetical protein N431DRAFT_437693 [Stipitochalara longipes BDJ]|nr:hypothetical protein N431DRAFT_437693 [Stipitochalara longipes BDJ]